MQNSVKVRYNDLKGLPKYDGEEIKLLKVKDKRYEDVSMQEFLKDAQLQQYIIQPKNCVILKDNNFLEYDNGFKVNVSKESPFKYADKEGNITTITSNIEIEGETHNSLNEWEKVIALFDIENKKIILTHNQLTVKRIEPIVLQNNLYWLNSKTNEIKKYSTGKWKETNYIILGEIDIHNNNETFVYNYPLVANNYEETLLSSWTSYPIKLLSYPLPRRLGQIGYRMYDIMFVNKIADNGYEVGDMAELVSDYNVYVNNDTINLVIDTDNLKLKGLGIVNSEQSFSLENWDIVYKIW